MSQDHLNRVANASASAPGSWYGRLRDSLSTLVREIAKFGVVGLVALVVDIGLFNILRFASRPAAPTLLA